MKKIKIIGINGSPRKNGNSATMLQNFMDGSVSAGNDIETDIYNLYDLSYTGCISCFGCKRAGSSNYGKCIVKDDIEDLLQKVLMADGVVFASPIYLGNITGQLRCFLERLIFSVSTYEAGYKTIAPKRLSVAMIYTMNVTEEVMKSQYDENLTTFESFIGHVFSPPQRICAFNTYQFKNYNDYKIEVFSEEEKAEHREKQFPEDCRNAFKGGIQMVRDIRNSL